MTKLYESISNVEKQLHLFLLIQEATADPTKHSERIEQLQCQLETLYDEAQAIRRFERSSIYAS